MAEKIYPKGINVFAPRDGAPDFVKGKMIVTLNDFVEWAKTQSEHYSEYEGKKQLKFDVLSGDKGLYFVLDTYKAAPKKEAVSESDSDLPF